MEMECSDEEYIDYNFKLKIINFYQDILELEDFGFSYRRKKKNTKKASLKDTDGVRLDFPMPFRERMRVVGELFG